MRLHKSQIVTLGLGLSIFALLVLFVALVIHKSTTVAGVKLSQEELVISEKDDTFVRFQRSVPLEIEGAVLDFDKRSLGVRGGGAVGYLIYLSKKDYQTVTDRYESLNRCPARFLNSHMKVLALIPSAPYLQSTILSADLTRGKRFLLKGEYLKFSEGKYSGHNLKLAGGQAEYFAVKNINAE